MKKFCQLIAVTFLTVTLSTSAWALGARSLDVTITADTGFIFDDNITFLKDDPVDDLINSVSLGLEVSQTGKKSYLDFDATISQEFFHDNSDFNNLSEEAELDFRYQLTPYDQVLIKNYFIQADEPRSFQDAIGRNEGRYDYLLNNFQIEYIRQFSKKVSLVTSYYNDTFSPDRADIVSSLRHDASIELDYILGSDLTVLFGYNFDTIGFDPGDHISIHSGYSGFSMIFKDKIKIYTKIGYDKIERQDDDKFKPQFLLQISDAIEGQTDVSFMFLKKYGSNFYQEDILDFWQVSAYLTQEISQRTKFNASIFYGAGEFLAADDDKTFLGATLGLKQELKEDLEIGLTYAFSNFTSSLDTDEYQKNVIEFSLAWNF